jgi:hypothetical protein
LQQLVGQTTLVANLNLAAATAAAATVSAGLPNAAATKVLDSNILFLFFSVRGTSVSELWHVSTCCSLPMSQSMRELYVGNLPSGILGPQLAEFLGAAIQQLKLNTAPGNPIINTWLSSDGHYAFCEFRTIDECNNALGLHGIALGTSSLRIGRPKNYQGPMPVSRSPRGIGEF